MPKRVERKVRNLGVSHNYLSLYGIFPGNKGRDNLPKGSNILISKLFPIWKREKEMARCKEMEKSKRNSVF